MLCESKLKTVTEKLYGIYNYLNMDKDMHDTALSRRQINIFKQKSYVIKQLLKQD